MQATFSFLVYLIILDVIPKEINKQSRPKNTFLKVFLEDIAK